MNKYKITTPCSQDWNKMETVENGRFCKHCNKTVHDLTDNKDFIPPSTNETFCGRIIDETSLIPKKISFSRLIFWQRMMKLSPILASLLLGKTGFGQTKDSVVYSKDTIDIKAYEQTDLGKIIISGILKDDKTLEGIPFGNVIIEVNNTVVGGDQTDIDGKFKIILDTNFKYAKTFDLKVSYVGYTSRILKDIPITKKNFVVDFKLSACSMRYVTGFIISTECPPLLDKGPEPSGGVINKNDIKHSPR